MGYAMVKVAEHCVGYGADFKDIELGVHISIIGENALLADFYRRATTELGRSASCIPRLSRTPLLLRHQGFSSYGNTPRLLGRLLLLLLLLLLLFW